jgi:hypothetical protein
MLLLKLSKSTKRAFPYSGYVFLIIELIWLNCLEFDTMAAHGCRHVATEQPGTNFWSNASPATLFSQATLCVYSSQPFHAHLLLYELLDLTLRSSEFYPQSAVMCLV